VRSAIWLVGLLLLSAPAAAEDLVAVPFVGCLTVGQGEELPAPTKSDSPLPRFSKAIAQKLAYYGMANSGGVLAPRGWHCIGFYGSSGAGLIVLPQRFDFDQIFAGDLKTTGPLVRWGYTLGGTSGRFQVAEEAPKFFPGDADLLKLRQFIVDTFGDPDDPDDPFLARPEPEPYPEGSLTRQRDSIVTYRVAPMAEGIGTGGLIQPGPDPVLGAVQLHRPDLDLQHVQVRLPPGLANLAPVILREAMPALNGGVGQKPE
jgi:hypothetical protein